MINQIFAISRKEFKVLLHDRGAFISLFVIPIAFILVMTVALQGLFSGGGSSNPVSMLVVNQDQGEIAGKIIANLQTAGGISLVEEQGGQPLTRDSAETLITSGQYSVALVFPSDFSSSIIAAATDSQTAPSTVTFITDPAMSGQLLLPIRGMVQGAIDQAASMAQAPQRAMASFNQMAANAPASQTAVIQQLGSQFAAQMGNQTTDSQNLGIAYSVVSPASYQVAHTATSAEQNVPGYTIFGVFFIMQIVATSLFREKNEGTFRRLQAAPISNAVLLTGKMLPYYLINLIQITSMFIVGALIFQMSLGNNLLALAVVSLAASAAATGMGLLLAALTKTQEQAGSLGALLSIVLAAVGGMMVPREVMPQFMQSISLLTPHAWALTGFQDVIVRGLGVQAVLPAAGILLGYAAAFWGIALWRFKFAD